MAATPPARPLKTPIVHRKKADLVYDHLREQIVNGAYEPGQRMTLAQLSSELGLSHMPVREALLRLEREGLLESEPHKGMRVVQPSLDDALELLQIRCELESLAACRACEHGDAAVISELKAIHEQFSTALRNFDFRTAATINRQFHRLILTAAKSPQLSRFLEDAWTNFARYRLGYEMVPERCETTIAEHARLITALESDDPEAARHAARAHMVNIIDELKQIIAERARKIATPPPDQARAQTTE